MALGISNRRFLVILTPALTTLNGLTESKPQTRFSSSDLAVNQQMVPSSMKNILEASLSNTQCSGCTCLECVPSHQVHAILCKFVEDL